MELDDPVAKTIAAAIRKACLGAGRAAKPLQGWGPYWLDRLHDELERIYCPQGSGTRVLSRKSNGSVKFGSVIMQEFMFDMPVVQMPDTVASPMHQVEIARRGRAIWIIESEMSVSGAEVAADLAKFILEDAENKLLITCNRGLNTSAFNNFVLDYSRSLRGQFFLAYIPNYASRSFSDVWLHEGGDIPYALWRRSEGQLHHLDEIAAPQLTSHPWRDEMPPSGQV